AAVRALYEYHARYLDRGDLAYNYLVDAEGCVYEGRAGGAGVVGAHAAQYDWGSIGVALLDDYDATDVPAAMLAGLTELLAWQCADHQIDPMGEELFIDTVLPSIMAHQDCRPTACPGRRLYALLPQIRSETLQKMAHVPPQIRLIAPTEGSLLRAVQPVSIEASAAITRVDIYVDGALRIRDRRDDAPDTSITSRWNTTLEADGPRRLRVVALNSAGQGEAEITVIVDNTPPGGSANVAAWSRTFDVPIALSAPDAVTMQISNGWWWEGEDLPRSVGMGGVISDATALSGLAWHGRAGSDPPGGVYGPYACNLAAGQSYTVCFRLRTPHYQRSEGLATLDVVDSGGERLFSRRALAGWDFAGEGYEEFCLDLAYPDRGATCRDPDVRDGLEFRTWFSGRGDLSLDRVTVYSAPRTHLEPVVRWTVSPVQGAQDILLRFLDEAGNAFLYPLTVRVDTMPPVWFGYEPGAVQVQDEVSGLDPATAAWTVSHDGGDAWGAWQPLSVQASSGSVEPLRLQAPAAEGTHVRFRLSDVAGNASESAPVSLTQLPTPSPTASPSPTATATVTPEATLPPPSPTPDRAHRVTIPLLLK
ncbi:MAG: hypothetical protein FJZ90_16370, partial [Chloroflexi bacterium]|nr:hypothetical protein [Chloroflexota bacterium]